ncbi:energy-coupling factor ABC transporter ATP-binding protein [Nocardioides sp. zg-536]|uniref:Energy-coupling factor ABC transporter ATP-binding protein n=1 Tax=Nocardioides faecalis TaxID=2803858 RepID=A0A938Y3D6_9ACTN|nr:ABC transporter ATP-binding protein [Nocardioides faecalis]MBM9459258.1 energy-coupling factor ABC transporter ATP-binding protein [Nocardioides faecalis]QVI59611.1 energy-coupling factor ABC transporter ATP-binding protein [Nocardioides faecalis]
MLQLRDVTFSYDDPSGDTGDDRTLTQAPAPVLDRVDLTIDDGELVVLAGPTGVGKSTLLGVVAGLVPAFSGGTLSGDVLLDGVRVTGLPARERAHVIGYVGQNPPTWFVTDTVEEELAFGMEQLGVAPAAMRRRVEETLDVLGIADLRHRDLRTLSGGQQQRVAIGCVLTTHPRLLVLDEPTSALDPTAAEDVLATLTRLVQDLGVSVLVAEHRLERVLPFADQLCVLGADPLRGGRLVTGAPAEVLPHAPVAPPLVELGRLAGWDPLPLTVRDARRAAATLRPRLGPPPHPVTPTAASPAPASPIPNIPAGEAPPSVSVRRLVVAHGRHPVLREVSFDLRPGTVTALMGRNGAGKSTLLWTLQGRHTPASGTVRVAGSEPSALSAAQRRAHTGLVPQSPADLLYLETVAQECAAADASADAPAGTCADLLERLAPGIAPDHHPRDLSEGQRLALAVAIVLTARPPVLLLDEPTRGLDYPAKRALAAILRELAAGNGTGAADPPRTVLLATHDVEFVAQVADELLMLAEGEIVSAAPVAQALTESPAFAPQVTKVLGPGWLTVADVADALARGAVEQGLR